MDKVLKMFLMFADTVFNVHNTSDLDVFIPEHWDTKVRRDAERKSFWDKFEGSEGSNSAIITRNDFESKPGDLVHVNVHSNLRGAGVSGETELRGKEEKLSFRQFDLKVDWIRHAVGFNKRATARAMFDAVKTSNAVLSTWLAKKKDDDLTAQLMDLAAQRHIATADSASVDVVYPLAVTAISGLSDDDYLTVASLNKVKSALIRKQTLPIETMVDGKQLISFYAIVADDIATEYYLKNDTVWQQMQREAGLRGQENKLFTGAFGSINGMVVYQLAGKAGEGSFLRPEVQVGTQSLANAEILLGVSGDRIPYQQYFANAATKYIATHIADGAEHAVTMDAGAITASLANETEIAKQYHLVAHTHAQLEVGDTITQENHYATAIAFGAEVAARVWGMYPKPITDVRDYGFQNGIGIEAVYGCKMIEKTDGKAPNHVLLRHYCKNPYLGI